MSTIVISTRLFREWDEDRQGTLDVDEFVKGVSTALPGIADEEALKQVFAAFDKDGSGFIRSYEFVLKLYVSCYIRRK